MDNKLTNKKVLFTATVDSHILHFHIPYLKMFKEKGYEVHVATNGDETIPYCDKKHKIYFERSPFKLNNLKAIRALKKVIDSEKFEIIHCHTPMGSVVTRLAALKSRKSGTRVMYTAHGFHFFKGASLKNWAIFYPVEKLLSKYTDTLITINEEDYNLAKKKFYSKQIELVHGVGVDPKKFEFEFSDEEKDSLRQEIGVDKDDFVMIYPAELSKRKNQGMLLRCMAELVNDNKKIKLLLPGLDSMNGLYQKMAKDLNIEENVKFLGYRKDIPKLLKISDLAVSAARQEGLPVNIMEAMVCGIPAVVTNCRGNRDLVQNGVNGYIVEIDDDSSFINNVKIIIKDKKHDECANKLNSKFLLEEVKNEMNNLYFNRVIKVCHFVCGLSLGGAEQVIYNFCSNLDSARYKFYLVYQHEPNQKNVDEFEKLGFELIKIKSKKENIFSNMTSTKNIIKQNKFDVVHSHMNIMNWIPLRYAKKYGTKIRISHSHTSNIDRKNIVISLIEKVSKKLNIIYATHLVACGEESGKYLYGNKKFIILNNAISFFKFKFNLNMRNEIRHKLGVNNEEYLIGHVGRTATVKNHKLVLKIFEDILHKNNNVKLLLIGDENLEKMIDKYISNPINKSNIIIKTNISNVCDYYQAMDCFILPSYWEGMPMVGIEAQFSGLKCYFSDKISSKVCISDNCKMLSICDSKVWVDSLLKDKDRKYSRNVDFEESEYNIVNEVKKLDEMYQL